MWSRWPTMTRLYSDHACARLHMWPREKNASRSVDVEHKVTKTDRFHKAASLGWRRCWHSQVLQASPNMLLHQRQPVSQSSSSQPFTVALEWEIALQKRVWALERKTTTKDPHAVAVLHAQWRLSHRRTSRITWIWMGFQQLPPKLDSWWPPDVTLLTVRTSPEALDHAHV